MTVGVCLSSRSKTQVLFRACVSNVDHLCKEAKQGNHVTVVQVGLRNRNVAIIMEIKSTTQDLYSTVMSTDWNSYYNLLPAAAQTWNYQSTVRSFPITNCQDLSVYSSSRRIASSLPTWSWGGGWSVSDGWRGVMERRRGARSWGGCNLSANSH